MTFFPVLLCCVNSPKQDRMQIDLTSESQNPTGGNSYNDQITETRPGYDRPSLFRANLTNRHREKIASHYLLPGIYRQAGTGWGQPRLPGREMPPVRRPPWD